MPISRRQSWRPWATKDPASETTAIANEHVRLIVSRVASDATLRRNLSTIQANGLRWRRKPVKDPAAEITAIANERTRVVVSRVASDAYLRRNLNAVQANGLIQRRQRWRKDPSAEVAPTHNSQIARPIGNQQASGQALLFRQQSTRLANALRWRREPVKSDPPVTSATRNERIQVQTGLLATQRARRAVIASVQPSLRLWRVLAWFSQPDTTAYIGDIALTEGVRSRAFTEVTRGALDEFVRSRAVIEMNRGALTELSRSLAFTEPDL